MGTSRSGEGGQPGAAVGGWGISWWPYFPTSRMAGWLAERVRPVHGPRRGGHRRGALRLARGGDAAGGAPSELGGAPPPVGVCRTAERCDRLSVRRVPPGARLRLSSTGRVALPKPPPEARPSGLAGASAVVAFAWAAWALAQFGELSSEAAVWAARGHTAGLMLAAFDVLLPFSLFSSFDGRRVWDWKRPAWGLLVVAVLGLFLAGG